MCTFQNWCYVISFKCGCVGVSKCVFVFRISVYAFLNWRCVFPKCVFCVFGKRYFVRFIIVLCFHKSVCVFLKLVLCVFIKVCVCFQNVNCVFCICACVYFRFVRVFSKLVLCFVDNPHLLGKLFRL